MKKSKIVLSLVIATLITISVFPHFIVSAMTPQEGANWALAQVGRWIDTDNYAGAQCVDLIVEYCKTNFSWNPQGSGNASAYRTVKLPNSSWQRIQNTPEFIPQPGDIAIWNPAASNGYCGHVAIIISANINNFVSVDQNLKGSANGSAAEKTTHNYTNFWGVIRPPFTSQNTATSVPTKSQTVGDGLYTLKNVASGYMINIYAGKDANGTKVTTWEFDGTTDQRIYIQHQGNGKHLLKFNASGSGRVIDVNRGESLSASIDDGDKIDIWSANDLDAQYFWINNVGDNAYTFELATKPGHVIAASSASAASSNGTQLELKNYTGANHQKWYLCDISGNIIGKCSHKNTTQKITGTSYKQKNDTTHLLTTKYNVSCSECNEITQTGLSKETEETHSFSNNKCEKCGYEIVLENKCKHNKTTEKTTGTTIQTKNATSHLIITKYNLICSDCNETVQSELTKESDENHTLTNNKCSTCGYESEVSKSDNCPHSNTYQGEIISSTLSVKNDTHHSVKEIYDVFCRDCGKTVEKSLTGTRTEPHVFSNGTCTGCGYENKLFPDITDDELRNIAETLSGYGIINGYQDGTFKPFNNITRAEFSKMICLAGNFNTNGTVDNNFEDVSASHWAYKYIYSSKRFGIINGISSTTFAPEENITYEQTIKMIVASLGYNNEAIQYGGYPEGYIEMAKELGILDGINFVRKDYATRANVSKMINSAMSVPFYELSEENGTISRKYSLKSLHELHNQ